MKILLTLLVCSFALAAADTPVTPKPLTAEQKLSVLNAKDAASQQAIAYLQAQIQLLQAKEKFESAQSQFNSAITAVTANVKGGCTLSTDLSWNCPASPKK